MIERPSGPRPTEAAGARSAPEHAPAQHDRVDPQSVAEHLAARYGIAVAGMTALDTGVLRVSRRDGVDWVARIFGPQRPADDVEAEAAILGELERRRFPAERCAHPQAVSTLGADAILVTEYITPAAPPAPGRAAAILGALLGRLHADPAEHLRPGGAWHHLSPIGTPREEIAAAAALLEEAALGMSARGRALCDRLRAAVARTDDASDLPHAFVHPDFVLANAVPTDEHGLVIVDWTGAGRGPRLWSLGFLLWAVGGRSPKLLDLAVSRYRRHITLEPDELGRLAGAIRGRPVMLACWSYCAGRTELGEAVRRVEEASDLADRMAARARDAFASPNEG